MSKPRFIPLPDQRRYSDEEITEHARAFCRDFSLRRTVRHFSERPVPREVIENCIRAAGSAPSGANLQPWHFVVVSDPEIKKRIREGAEKEEREFYERRATSEWLKAIEPLGTDSDKPFLVVAPWLIVIFVQRTGRNEDGGIVKHYYAMESVGIATGMLIAAVHHAGLASLTHTPSPMKFLNHILGRPAHESPFLILVVGHPAEGAKVPDIRRKPLSHIASFV